MEQQNVQVEEGISLLDIVKLLLAKIKLLILVILIGGFLGAGFAVWRTVNVNYWGSSIEFYVNPEKASDSITSEGSQYGIYGVYSRPVMDNMIRLLKSESFIEQIMLNGESLPKKEDNWATPDEEADLALNAKIDEAIAADIDGKIAALEEALMDRNNAKTAAEEADYNLSEEWKRLHSAGDENISTKLFNQTIYDELIADSDAPAYFTLKRFYAMKVSANEQFERDEAGYKSALAAKKAADVVVERALDAWSKTEKYQTTLKSYKEALAFSYLEDEDDFDDANNLARSFIYVDISVLNDKDFAQDLLNRIKTLAPAYIEQKMPVPDGYTSTNCERITRTDDIQLTNPRYTTKQAIKFGALAAIIAFAVACLVIVILDRSDKRLRDTETITRQFNVPLLGIVPNIEALNAEQTPKKKGRKNNSEVE